ncbi:MAG TPA: hypothetical protein VNL71_20190 [Chloroflexota bacterium]|nr:hypothetical protein [Chloroflexota bacterium]
MTAFNKLSHDQAERLALLLEEMGEAQQIIGKILRHGYDSTHPDGVLTNRDLLENELGDVDAAVQMLTRRGDLSSLNIKTSAFCKLQTVQRYLHHQSVARDAEDSIQQAAAINRAAAAAIDRDAVDAAREKLHAEDVVKARASGYAEGFEAAKLAAIALCEEQRTIFLSPEYATGQPLSSLQERFACSRCVEAIAALKPEPKP